jgi:hypothetical protein
MSKNQVTTGLRRNERQSIKRCAAIGFVAGVNAETEKINALTSLVNALTELVKSTSKLLYAVCRFAIVVLLIVGLLCR